MTNVDYKDPDPRSMHTDVLPPLLSSYKEPMREIVQDMRETAHESMPELVVVRVCAYVSHRGCANGGGRGAEEDGAADRVSKVTAGVHERDWDGVQRRGERVFT